MGLTEPPKGVKYISMHGIGYGVAAKRYLLALSKTNTPITWTPMVKANFLKSGFKPFLGDSVGDPLLDAFCNKKIDYDTVIIHTIPEYYPEWIDVEKGKKIIGCTVWETTAIPKHWKDLLNSTDRLLVPCKWNKEVFQECGVTVPIDVIPHAIEEQELPKSENVKKEIFGIPPNDYVFYSINEWTERKSIWKTIDAYCQTFTFDDPTTLIIKTSKKDFTKSLFNQYLWSSKKAIKTVLKQYKKPPKVKYITHELSDMEILQLHAIGDCYISLCRSEGWGLGAFDAARYANPLIMTGFGGQLEYLDKSLSYLVNYNLVLVDKLFSKTCTQEQKWAEPNIENAKKLLRNIFENQEQAKQKAVSLQKQIKEKFSTKVIGDRLLSILSEI